jgi:hypothetical protein
VVAEIKLPAKQGGASARVETQMQAQEKKPVLDSKTVVMQETGEA